MIVSFFFFFLFFFSPFWQHHMAYEILAPRPGIELTVQVQSLNHWIAREVPMLVFIITPKCTLNCNSFTGLSPLHWRRQWQPIPVLLPGESHGWWNLVGFRPRGCKESDMTDFIFKRSSWFHCFFYFLVSISFVSFLTFMFPSFC